MGGAHGIWNKQVPIYNHVSELECKHNLNRIISSYRTWYIHYLEEDWYTTQLSDGIHLPIDIGGTLLFELSSNISLAYALACILVCAHIQEY